MSEQWFEVLRQAEISYFHARYFGPGKVEVYKHLSKRQRADVQKSLMDVIKRHALFGFVVMINPTRFDETDLADGYSFCANACVGSMISKLKTERVKGEIAFFFEEGHKNAGRAIQYLAESQTKKPDDAVGSVRFIKKDKSPLLQAADMLVWHCAKYVKDRVSDQRKPRKDFVYLTENDHSICYALVENHTISLSFANKLAIDSPNMDEMLRETFERRPS